MEVCPECQTVNDEGAQVCVYCGQRLGKRGLLSRIFGRKRKTGTALEYEVLAESYTGTHTEQLVSQSPEAPPAPQPDTAEALKERGREHLDLGRYRQAAEACDQAIALDPGYADAYYNRGLAYYNLSQFPRALEDFDQALRLVPDDADYHASRGMVLLMLERAGEATADYGEALRLEPANPDHYVGRGAAYFDLGRFQESIWPESGGGCASGYTWGQQV